MNRALAELERVSRQGPSMFFSLVRVVAIYSVGLLVIAAFMGVMLGGHFGLAAESLDEARVPADELDIDVRDVEPVDNPIIPDRFEHQLVDSRGQEPSNGPAWRVWYLAMIQSMLDTAMTTAVVVGNVTARFAFANKWVPGFVYSGVGVVGLLGGVAYRITRLWRMWDDTA
ncbi:hypothetical protein [Haloferax sp. Atlit-48N]|uniref:Uncharacterized protein n=2 Tax=Halobacteriales TaxID=2235 RepID=A0ACD5HX30_9EURY|nr:hypothetical protein [Haloferax sp. Atlit-48N]